MRFTQSGAMGISYDFSPGQSLLSPGNYHWGNHGDNQRGVQVSESFASESGAKDFY